MEQVGAPLTLYNHPANQFVAGFIGSPRMNFLPGIVGEAGRTILVEGLASVPVGDREGLRPGDKVTLGIRPEHLNVVPGGIGASVQSVEQAGRLELRAADPA